MKPRVYFTRLIPEAALKKLAENCDYRVWEGELPVPRDILLQEVPQVDALLSLLTDKIDGAVMNAAPRLRVISNMGETASPVITMQVAEGPNGLDHGNR
jgi:glyoxylate reductase